MPTHIPELHFYSDKLLKFREEAFTNNFSLGRYLTDKICEGFRQIFLTEKYEYIILKIRKTWSIYCALKPLFDRNENFNEMRIINDRLIDVYRNEIKESLRRGKKVLLVDDCTITGSTLSKTLRELKHKYGIDYEKIDLFSFFVNYDLRKSRISGDMNEKICYFDSTKENPDFVFYEMNDAEVYIKDKPISVNLFNPDHIQYRIVTDVKFISNMMLKAIHESVSPYVSYLPCQILQKHEGNSDFITKIIDESAKHWLNVDGKIPHDFFFRKNSNRSLNIIPLVSQIDGYRKYIRIITTTDNDYLYIAPYVYLPDKITFKELHEIYDELIGGYFPISNTERTEEEPRIAEFEHRRLKHFLSVLLFKEFIIKILDIEYNCFDLAACGFYPIMTEIFGECCAWKNPNCAYIKMVNNSFLSTAEQTFARIHCEKAISPVFDYETFTDESGDEVSKKVNDLINDAYKNYIMRVGK